MPVFIVRGIKTAQWLDKNGEEEFISYTIYAFQNYNVKKELYIISMPLIDVVPIPKQNLKRNDVQN